MKKIVLISCTKKKKDCRCAAWELYSASELFKKELVYARELTTDKYIYVLSAKHGLIQLTDELDPYNQTLNGAKKSVVVDLSHGVFRQMQGAGLLDCSELVFLAGNNYRKHLIPLIMNVAPKVKISVPAEGLRIGQQLKFFKNQTVHTSGKGNCV